MDCWEHDGVDIPRRDRLMGTDVRVYNSGDTFLYIYPSENMTWGLLDDLQMDLRNFQMHKLDNPRQTSFILLEGGIDVGHGAIGL